MAGLLLGTNLNDDDAFFCQEMIGINIPIFGAKPHVYR